jgi:hypothetical protein
MANTIPPQEFERMVQTYEETLRRTGDEARLFKYRTSPASPTRPTTFEMATRHAFAHVRILTGYALQQFRPKIVIE